MGNSGINICFLILLLIFTSQLPLDAQAPMEDWRSNRMPMVAERGGYPSLYINPAGLYGSEQGVDIYIGLPVAGGTVGNYNPELLSVPKKLVDQVLNLFDVITTSLNLGNDNAEFTARDADSIKDVLTTVDSDETLKDILKGTSLEDDFTFDPENPTAYLEQLSEEDIVSVIDESETIVNNIQSIDPAEIAGNAINKTAEKLNDIVKDAEMSSYITIANVGTSFEIAQSMAFSAGLLAGSKLVISANPETARVGRYPYQMETGDPYIGNITINPEIRLTMQSYFQAGGRVGVAFPFLIENMSVGFSFDYVYFAGLNEENIFNKLLIPSIPTDVNSALQNPFQQKSSEELANEVIHSTIGIDAGLIYNFAALGVDWLTLGINVRDLIGFTFRIDGQKLRYSLDVDLGAMAEFEYQEIIVYGGADLLEIRGMLADPSPYSTLASPVSHLRLLGGVRIFGRTLDFSIQYFNYTTSTNLSLLNDFFGITINSSSSGVIGLEAYLILRF